jgi:hypothetical protein
MGNTNRNISIQAGLDIEADPISKATRTKGLEAWLKW